jgi:hypothetical protein
MRIDKFHEFLEIHGADFARWPAAHGAEAETLIENDPGARKAWNEARRLDELISRHLSKTPDTNIAAASRVLGTLRQPLPRQKGTLFAHLPGVLLDWNFAPAWPRVAALAGFAALGFLIGISGIDRQLEGGNFSAAAATDIFSDSDLTAGF